MFLAVISEAQPDVTPSILTFPFPFLFLFLFIAFEDLSEATVNHTKPEMRLLRMNSDGIVGLIQFPERDVPSYADLPTLGGATNSNHHENKRKRSEL